MRRDVGWLALFFYCAIVGCMVFMRMSTEGYLIRHGNWDSRGYTVRLAEN